MKITFITNYMTHHQLPFAKALYELLGDDFLFIETNSMENERKNMGWQIDNNKYPFIKQFENSIYDDAILEGDVVILGGTHEVYLGSRLDRKKLTFRYFERLYKKGQYKAFIPSSYRSKLREHTSRKEDAVYLLCAGAYVASDFSLFGAYPEKMFKWGYFPEFVELDIESVLKKKERKEILWTGRMIDWKMPLMPLKAALILKKRGVDFHLTMIGNGAYIERVKDFIKKNSLEKEVTLLDFVTPEKVREYMIKSSVYLMTSNMQEGWGAVVNEAMNSGCSVIASYGAGSVPYLIRHNMNGLVYDYKKVSELADCIENVIANPELSEKLGKNAYCTIKECWNAKEAASRFVRLCDRLITRNSEDTSIHDEDYEQKGPLSRAEVISPGKGYKYCKMLEKGECR